MTEASCSFCGKPQDQVAKVIAGPEGVYICDECVALCSDIIAENLASPAEAPPPEGASTAWRSYSAKNPPPVRIALRTLQHQLSDIAEQLGRLAERNERDDE